jgi:hypothetical protein
VKKIAILTQGIEHVGGVPSVARGIAHAIQGASDFEATIISIAESFRDPGSRRVLSPRTWARKSLAPNNHH